MWPATAVLRLRWSSSSPMRIGSDWKIQDNGIGFDPIANQDAGFGLISMRDRLAELNGKLELYSGDENGTRLVALVPRSAKV